MSCVFCEIAQKQIPATIEWEDEEYIAIRDINPQAPVHILIMPKQHFRNVEEAESSVVGRLIEIAQRLARERGLDRGYRIVINTGPEGGQTIYHLHIHLLGGRPFGWPPG
ncbi:histidine triad nucleotide-binding protein [Coprothermobacteraceae bacterium]|nr:histidine triad nucleotide-binding protein [Coprothermobacteraceae bacterium]